MMRLWYRHAVGGLGLVAVGLLVGCGGGGETTNGLTGVVTDVAGKAVAGARVTAGGASGTSLSNGTFTLSGVGAGLQTVRADITVEGHRWSGETVVDLASQARNRSINVMVSDERTQGGIGGSVIDPNGFPIRDAKVFVGGPLGSTMALTDSNGDYEVDRLASGVQYTVTASVPGYLNDSKNVSVVANQVTAASFALAAAPAQGAIPAPQNLSAEAYTIAGSITRKADGRLPGVYEWLKRLHRQRKRLPDGPVARQVQRVAATRATPAGSVIEIDLFWNYQAYTDLLGYAIWRGPAQDRLSVNAYLRDPLATVFFDVDPALTPDVTTWYAVSRLDTVEFPDNGTVGPKSAAVSAMPLEPLHTTAPSQGASVTGDPVLRWTAVNGATAYQVYVWDRFPDVQDADEPDGVSPIWPSDTNNPGSSLVTGTQTTYAGPALQAGHTYYWMVVAEDSSQTAFSASAIMKFVAR